MIQVVYYHIYNTYTFHNTNDGKRSFMNDHLTDTLDKAFTRFMYNYADDNSLSNLFTFKRLT